MTHEDLPLIQHSWGVYLLRNLITGKVYIGSSVDLRDRLVDHYWELRNGTHCNRHLLAAWKKYGERAFQFEILEELDSDDLLELRSVEGHWIQSLQSFDRRYGYNSEVNPCYGQNIRRFSEETIERMRQAARIRMSDPDRRRQASLLGHERGISPETRKKMTEKLRGRHQSEEHKQKRAEAQRGHHHSAETREKLRQRRLELPEEIRSQTGRANKGRTHTPESRANMGASHVGSKRSEETKRKMAAARREWWARRKEKE